MTGAITSYLKIKDIPPSGAHSKQKYTQSVRSIYVNHMTDLLWHIVACFCYVDLSCFLLLLFPSLAAGCDVFLDLTLSKITEDSSKTIDSLKLTSFPITDKIF